MAFNGWGSFAGGLASGFNETARTMAILREGQQRQQELDAQLAQQKADQASLQALATAAQSSDAEVQAQQQDRAMGLTLGQKLSDLATIDPKLRGPIVDQYVADIQKQTGAVLATPVVKLLKSTDAPTLQGLVKAANDQIAGNPTIGFTGLVQHLSDPQTATDTLVGLIKQSGVAQQATEMGQPAPQAAPTDPMAGVKLQLAQLQARRQKFMDAYAKFPTEKSLEAVTKLTAPLDAQIGKLQDLLYAGPKALVQAQAQQEGNPTEWGAVMKAAGGDPAKALALRQQMDLQKANAQGEAGQKYLDERKLAYYRSLGLPEPDIHDLVYGLTRLTTPDPSGNLYIVNVRTGATKQIVGGPAQTPEGTPAPQAAAPTAPPLGMSAKQAATEGSGPWAAGRQFINNTYGAFFSPLTQDAPFPDTAKAKNVLQYIRNAAKSELVVNRRAPVYDQQQVEDMVPTGQSVFEDPHVAVAKLQTLKQNLQFKQQENVKSLASAQITPKRRADLVDQNDGINHILNLLGDVPAPSQTYAPPPEINDLLKKYGQ